MNQIFFFLPGILLLGIVTSYTDIRYGKIRNWAILASIIFAFIAYLVLIASGFSISGDFMISTLINFILAAIVGYLLWYFNLWTAGDGKLFSAYALLLPIFAYRNLTLFPLFPAITIMINTFVPLFLLFFLMTMFRTSMRQKIDSVKKTFDAKNILIIVLAMFVFSWLIPLFYNLTGFVQDFFVSLVIILILFILCKKILKDLIFLILLSVISLARLILDKAIFTTDFIVIYGASIIFILVTTYFFNDLSLSTYTRKIRIQDVKAGMIMANVIYKKEKRLKRELTDFFKEPVRAEGLTQEDIKNLLRLKKKHPELKFIAIQETMPFAPFMFIGVLATLIAGGSIFG